MKGKLAIACAAAAWLLLTSSAWAQAASGAPGKVPDTAEPTADAAAEPPLSAALLLIKADWAQSPHAKTINDDLRAALKDATVPQALIDELPASGPQVLFPPDITLHYSIEHFAELAAWLKKNELIEKEIPFVRTTAAPMSNEVPAGNPRAPKLNSVSQLDLPSEKFLEFPSLPKNETPFVTRSGGFFWVIQAHSSGLIVFQRSIGTIEQARGQKPTPLRVLDSMSFSSWSNPQQVVVVNAFPTSREQAWRDLARKRGFVPIVIIQYQGAEAKADAPPRLHLPDSVTTIEASSGPEWNFDLSRGWSMFRGSGPPSSRTRGGTSSTSRQPESKQPESSMHIFPLTHVRAAAAEELIRRLFPDGITIAAESEGNQLVIRAPAQRLDEIKAVLQSIDQVAERRTTKVPSDSPDMLGDAPDDTSADMRGPPSADYRAKLQEQYDRLEQEAAEQARKLRALEAKGQSAPRDTGLLKAQLRKTVSDAFNVRQTLHQQELADLRRQTQSIEQSIQMRGRTKNQIIDRRVDELLHPEQKWVAPDSASAPHRPAPNSTPSTPAASKPAAGSSDPFGDLGIQIGFAERMQGTWVEIAQEQNGKRGDVLKHGFNFTFSGNEFQLRQFSDVYAKGTFQLVESGSKDQGLELNRTWNKLLGEGGAPQRDLGIVRIEGDLLAWCYGGRSSGELPDDFSTQAEDSHVLTIWRRISAKPLTDEEIKSVDFGALAKTDRPPDDAPGPADDLTQLRGVWEIVVVPNHEPQVTAGKQTRLVFSGSRLAVFDGLNRTRLWDISLDPGIRPKRITLTGLADTPSARGIYDADGDALRMNITEATGEWPKEFGAGGRFEFRRVSRDVPSELATDSKDQAPPTGSRAGSGKQAALEAADAASTRELASSLDGEWAVVAIRGKGVTATAKETHGMRWSIRDGAITGHNPDGSSGRMTFTLDHNHAPLQIDITAADGNRKGETDHCIYRLDGSRLLICLPEIGADRPADFRVSAESWLMELERIPAAAATGTTPPAAAARPSE